LPLKQQGINNL